MTRFSELNKLFTPWREQWLEEYRQHQILPWAIAEAFREYLGCPKEFSIFDEEPVAYVAPCLATRTSDGGEFSLKVNREPWKDIDIDADSYFYFGLQCHLETGANTFPKQPFWFLLRSGFQDEIFKVRVVRSGAEFDLPVSNPRTATDPLCEHLFGLIKQSLAVPAMSQRKPKNKIGFV